MQAVANDKTIHISKVESAVVSSIRQLSEQDLERDRNRNWALFGNSLLGGVLGYQYGNGSGDDVKRVLSTILAHNQKKIEGNELKSTYQSTPYRTASKINKWQTPSNYFVNAKWSSLSC